MRAEQSRIKTYVYISILVFGIFVLRLWQLQVLEGDKYFALSNKNRVRVFRIAASRGILYDRNGIKLVKNVPYYIVSVLPDIDISRPQLKKLSKLLHIPAKDIAKKIALYKGKTIEPIRLKEGLSFEEVAKIEAKRSDFPYLIIETDTAREYPFGPATAHLLGYIGKPSKEDLRSGIFGDINAESLVGKWGVERIFDKQLRGVDGKKFVEVDATGRQIRVIYTVPPQPGEDLYLSIDIHTQLTATKAIGKRAGALLALDPKTSEVLALVSLPAFDPNLFIHGIDKRLWRRLSRDPHHPLLNRVFQSQYPPGSIFKLVTAIAALEDHIASASFTVTCEGQIQLGQWRYRCWKEEGHGRISLHRAIVESCDVYFYELGRITGIDRIARYAKAFGFGQPTGAWPLGEKSGLIPDKAWKMRTLGRPWYIGETFNAAIGQGYVSVTPAQAAVFISAIANNGLVLKPQFLKDSEPEIISKVPLSEQTLRIIKRALRGVVNEPKGTGRLARSLKFLIAGKTGTAQVVKMAEGSQTKGPKDHAWFVAYAPYIEPKVGISVIIEHGGHGGETAAPVAKTVIESFLLSNETKKDKQAP